MKLLCLHGKCQTGNVLKHRLKRLETRCATELGVSFAYVDAPFDNFVGSDDGCGDEKNGCVKGKTWWLEHAALSTFRQSVALMEATWAKDGPFFGIASFSQGGVLAAYMCAHQDKFPGLTIAIFAGSPDVARYAHMRNLFENAPPIPRVETLHYIGSRDEVVTPKESASHASKFENAVIVAHEKGHCFPHTHDLLDKSFQLIKRAIEQPRVCISDEGAMEQCDEIEALLSIYSEEAVRIDQPAPTKKGEPCAKVAIRLEDGVDEKWRGELWLSVHVPPAYPEDSCVDDIAFSLETGKLNMLEWPARYTDAIISSVKEAAGECAGMPVIFSCVQAALDWFHLDRSALDLVVPDLPAETQESSVNCNEDPDAALTEEQAIKMATATAAAEAAKTLRGMNSSRRGLWKYKVGLVGKPSVGKSTLFNALTKSNGAAVGAFPFTTIEPNVGIGFYCSNAECDSSRRAYYGRDESSGGRLLPVIIKDVAGLVPGAYEGRGKGNMFLNDLVDCDVLIHVVDATGKSDKDGNIVEQESMGNADDDAEWVRWEIHRWIYDNVQAKMESVRAHSPAARFCALLSGYSAAPDLVERVATLAGMQLEKCREWTRMQLHTYIAHFVYQRFPITVALNKCDGINDKVAQVKDAVKRAALRGERAVPCSARMECLRLDDDKGTLLQRTMRAWGGTGTMRLVSAAVSMKPPILVYPVDDLESEAPIGSLKDQPLFDCLQFYPGSTIEDVYNCLLWSQSNVDGRLRFRPQLQLRGDFIRADGRGLRSDDGESSIRSRQFGRKHVVDEESCVLKIYTTR